MEFAPVRVAHSDHASAPLAAPGSLCVTFAHATAWQVLRHEEYDETCDVYSFAILAYEMLTQDTYPCANTTASHPTDLATLL